VRAIFRKELREYRHNGFIVWTMAIFPLIFLIQPLIVVFVLPASASNELEHGHLLLYMLGIPALVPAAVAAASIVGERQQGTLEPVLTTPIRREELVVGKALAPLLPSVAIAYAVYALFLASVELFARPGVAPALVHGADIVAQVVFTPPVAACSIWIAIAISARSSDTAAQHAGESPVGRRDDARLDRHDPRDARPGAGRRRGAGARERAWLADRVGHPRPRAARDRDRTVRRLVGRFSRPT
jgi:ABC-2 type transport system permease protein